MSLRLCILFKIYSVSFRQGHWNDDLLELQEEFKILLLNRFNKVIGIFAVSLGGIAGTVADPKLIFGCSLKAAASGIILAHNHPSGSLQPSQADMDLTKKLRDGGKLLDIQVLDHIIVPVKHIIDLLMKGSCSPLFHFLL